MSSLRISGVAALILALAAGMARADGDDRVAPVGDPLTRKECGACHMAFPAGLLPARSWQAMMDRLSDHFGEDAWLSDDTRARITAYLSANAADAQGRPSPFLRGLSRGETPLRISETPFWVAEHRGEVPDHAWGHPKVRSKANCIACHTAADRGYFGDD